MSSLPRGRTTLYPVSCRFTVNDDITRGYMDLPPDDDIRDSMGYRLRALKFCTTSIKGSRGGFNGVPCPNYQL